LGEGVEYSGEIPKVMTAHAKSFVVQTKGKGTYENADPGARTDLHRFFERLVPEDSVDYVHTAEGPDDSTSHLRMVLTRSSETVPVVDGRLALGTWQGIFVFEHRRAPHRRSVVVSVVGT